MPALFVQKAIDYAHQKLSIQEIRWLLEHVAQKNYASLMTVADIDFSESTYRLFCQLTDRISQGEPFDYVLGYSIFRDRQFTVNPAVLIPRPETESLVDTAINLVSQLSCPDILELGTGSGIIAISLTLEIPHARLTATDISVDALHLARQNAERHQVSINFKHSRWFDQIDGRYDLIVSNPPYIPEKDPHLKTLSHEPCIALASGLSGFDDISEIIDQAVQHLKPGGWLCFEHGFDQHEESQRRLKAAGYQQISSIKDAFGKIRVSMGQWP